MSDKSNFAKRTIQIKFSKNFYRKVLHYVDYIDIILQKYLMIQDVIKGLPFKSLCKVVFRL